MLSVGEITRKNVLHYDHGICNFEPKSAFHLNISLFSCLNVWIKLSNSSLAAIKLEYVKTFCCDPPSYTQVAGIRLGTGVKCSKVLTDTKRDSLHLILGLIILTYSWISSVLSVNFASSMTIPVWSSQQNLSIGGIMGDFIVPCRSLNLITITMVEGRQQAQSTISELPPH